MKGKPRIGASYNRASDQDEAEKERGTLDNQEFIGSEVAERLSQQTGMKHVIEYVLTEKDGVSGGTTDRPEYQTLCDLIETRRIDFVVAKEISRLNRSIKDFCDLMDLCKRNGVAVHIQGLNLSFDGPMGELVYKLLALIAEFERKLIIQRTKEGIRAGGLKYGKIHGGHVVLGFDRVEGEAGVWAPNADELKQVVRILDMVLQHDRAVSACAAINAEGIRTKKGQPFTSESLKRLILNRKFEGIHEVNIACGEVDPKTGKAAMKTVGEVRLFDPVVDLEKLKRAREQVRVWDSKKSRVRKRTYLLSGVIQTKDGTPLTGESGTGKNGEKRYYYRDKKGDVRIPAEAVEDKVIEAIACYQNDDEIRGYAAEAAAQLKSNVVIIDRQIAILKDRLRDVKDKEGELVSVFTGKSKTERTAEWLESQLAEFDKDRKELEQGITSLDRERQVLLESQPDPKNLKAVLEYVFKNFRQADPSVQRNFIRQVFERIEVVSKHEVRLYWRFPEIKNPLPPCDIGGSGFALEQTWGD